MPQVFQPHKVIYVKASHPHPINTEYRVAWGYETWGANQIPVTKVQMVYNGRVNGRISPSYPDGTPDQANVRYAEDLLKQGGGSNGKKNRIYICSVVIENGQSLTSVIESEEDALLNNLLNYIVPMDVGSVTCTSEENIKENEYRLIFELEAQKSNVHPIDK